MQPQEALTNAILLIVEIYVIVLKKSIFLYAVGMQHMRVCLDHQISHFLQIGLRLIAPGGMQIRQMHRYAN